jgi:hypothetical protein
VNKIYAKLVGAADIVFHAVFGNREVWLCRKCEELLDSEPQRNTRVSYCEKHEFSPDGWAACEACWEATWESDDADMDEFLEEKWTI